MGIANDVCILNTYEVGETTNHSEIVYFRLQELIKLVNVMEDMA